MSFRDSEEAMSVFDLAGLALRLLVVELIAESELRGFKRFGIMRTMLK